MSNTNNGNPFGNGSNPFDALKNLNEMRDLRKLLGPDFFKNLPIPNMGPSGYDEESPPVYPLADIYDRGAELLVYLDIPGIQRSDITLSVGSETLHIRGQVPPPLPKRDSNILLSERHTGQFMRDITLPVRVEPGKVRATYTNGVLAVYLTKQNPVDGEYQQSVPIDFE